MDCEIGVHMWSYVYHTLLMLDWMFKREYQFLNQGAWFRKKHTFEKYNEVHLFALKEKKTQSWLHRIVELPKKQHWKQPFWKTALTELNAGKKICTKFERLNIIIQMHLLICNCMLLEYRYFRALWAGNFIFSALLCRSCSVFGVCVCVRYTLFRQYWKIQISNQRRVISFK